MKIFLNETWEASVSPLKVHSTKTRMLEKDLYDIEWFDDAHLI